MLMAQNVQLAVRCVWKKRHLEQPTTRPGARSASESIPWTTEPVHVSRNIVRV